MTWRRVLLGVAALVVTTMVVASATTARPAAAVEREGDVHSFGAVPDLGDTDRLDLRAPLVGMAATPSGAGYWLVAADGGVFAFGDAAFFGSAGTTLLDAPMIGMAAAPSGAGYWLLADRTPAGPAVVLRNGDPARRVVALTFDGGSDCGNTGAILDTLASNAITATFALTGRWVEHCPADAARIGAMRHMVMNHSFDHLSFTGRSTRSRHLTTAEMLDQVTRATEAIRAATGRDPRPWFRPPFGDTDASVDSTIAQVGYRYDVLWTADSLGWLGSPPGRVVANVVSKMGNGGIVMMHLGRDSTDHLALQGVIDAARARGFTFVTLAGLL